ncbi:alpha-amylase family protein [Botrimarina sp.]|uniref:alpha-amylase family protein n=1 Tax=Botrimarina sp. TaxID=2795802 RepID=UPI0032EADE5B
MPTAEHGDDPSERDARRRADGALSRREVLALASTALLPAALSPALANAAATPEPAAGGREPLWYRNAYRRAVIDMHIPDWDPGFLAEFDPQRYADALVASRSESIVCYAHSHVGLFNYPTRVGRQHAAWKGRDAFGEVLRACRERGVAVVAYVSLIFDRDCADTHPEWRITRWDGQPQPSGRHGFCCPNTGYSDYVSRFATELCERYEVDGVRFDMTFWPGLCYCDRCRDRYASEVGGEIPVIVDWLDPRWVAFQRARSRWLEEFAGVATNAVKAVRPSASVEHQSSTYTGDWRNGVVGGLAKWNDFLQGDFYGSALQGSFVRKLLERLSPNRPFGYETSLSVSLQDHTATKPESLLTAKAAAAVADAAAFIFIDAINPDGSVRHAAHEKMGRAFDGLMPCYKELGGERVVDVLGYYSLESKFDFAENGRHVRHPPEGDSHTTAAMNSASRLLGRHTLYGVVTKESLDQLQRAKVLVLSDVNMMDAEECQRIREWVAGGGRLYASGHTSLVDKSGRRHDDFQLADVFGVSAREPIWTNQKRFLAPTAAGGGHFGEYNVDNPAFFNGPGMTVAERAGADVLATRTLPWESGDPRRFASIHSDPPWRPTGVPELTRYAYGRGVCIYSAAPIENSDVLADTFVRLIAALNTQPTLVLNGPGCVEATVFDQPDRGRLLLTLVNFQEALLKRGDRNVPVPPLDVRLRPPRRLREVRHLATGERVPFRASGGAITMRTPQIDTLCMLAMEADP